MNRIIGLHIIVRLIPASLVGYAYINVMFGIYHVWTVISICSCKTSGMQSKISVINAVIMFRYFTYR